VVRNKEKQTVTCLTIFRAYVELQATNILTSAVYIKGIISLQ